MSVSILGPGTKEFMNQGDFHAEGESMLLLKGVPPILWHKATSTRNYEKAGGNNA